MDIKGNKKRKALGLAVCLLVVSFLSACGGRETEADGNIAAENTETGSAATENAAIENTATGSTVTENMATESTATKNAAQNFSYELFRQNLEKENPVLSPVSAYLAVGLSGLGAKGETLEEYRQVMGVDFQDISQDLMNRLPQEEEGIKVAIANSAWLDERLNAEDAFLEQADSVYQAQVYQERLADVQTKDKINAWIEKETEGLIEEFLTQPLSPYDCLALFDAVYFEGKWQQPFESRCTEKWDFTTSSGETVSVDMMRKDENSGKQKYLQNDIAEGVLLPYQGGKYSFVALMPTGDLTVREMYEQMSFQEMEELMDGEKEVFMILRLPRFECTFDEQLDKSLKALGLKKAFDPTEADLSGIGFTQMEPLYISLVRQKAVFRLDEDGTKAAAATEVAIKDSAAVCLKEPPMELTFDKPFFYMIVDQETKTPLFMGIMENPGASKE